MLFLLCLAGIALVLYLCHRIFGHALCPAGVFFSIWLFVLGLYSLAWVRYIWVRPYTWVLISLSLLGFLAGWLLAWFDHLRRPAEDPSAGETILVPRFLRLLYIFFGFGLIGISVFLWNVHETVGIIEMLQSPMVVRALLGTGRLSEGIKLLNWLNVVVFVFSCFYLIALKGEKKFVVTGIGIFSLLSVLLMGDRTRFYFTLLWALFFIAHCKPWKMKVLFTRAFIGALLLVGQFMAVAEWTGKTVENNTYLTAIAQEPEGMRPLLGIYLYATASIPTLQRYIESDPPVMYGGMTFNPAYKLLRLAMPSLPETRVVAEFYNIGIPFNTFTWLHQFYADFRMAGVILGPALVGFICGLVYCGYRRRPTLYGLYLNSLLSVGLALSVMVNHLAQGPVWYFAALGALFCRYCVESRQVAPLTAPRYSAVNMATRI